MEVSMNLDRYTARALVDAGMMSLKEYIERFGSAEEQSAGGADSLHVVRTRPISQPLHEHEPNYGFPVSAREKAVIRFYCH
jgi:hypothetical protein